MEKETLVKGLGYLKVYYSKWELDIANDMVLTVWFDALKNIPDIDFKKIVKEYCMNHSYAPSSPTDIIKMIPKEYSMGEAEEIIRDTLSRNTIDFAKRELYDKYPIIYQFTKGLLDDIPKDQEGHLCIGYSVIKPFKRRYKAYLDSKTHYEGNRLVCSGLLLE